MANGWSAIFSKMRIVAAVGGIVGISQFTTAIFAQDGVPPRNGELPAPGTRPKTSSGTAEAPVSPAVKAKLDQFFKTLQEGKVSNAYRDLLKASNIGSSSVEGLIDETTKALETQGKISEAEFIRASKAGKYLVRVSYFSYSPKHPMQWEFFCYFTEGAWIILDIDVHNDLYKMFKLADDEKKKKPAPIPEASAVDASDAGKREFGGRGS